MTDTRPSPSTASPKSPIRVLLKAVAIRWSSWWKKQSPSRQDRLALIAPLIAVIFFFTTIAAAFAYLRFEEVMREEETLRRDIEYAQQRLRLRLLERQEQVTRLSKDISSGDVAPSDFAIEADSMLTHYPEINSISWIDPLLHSKHTLGGAGLEMPGLRVEQILASNASLRATFEWVAQFHQAAYAPIQITMDSKGEVENAYLDLFLPVIKKGRFDSAFLVEYKIDGLMRFVVPPEITIRNAVSLLDADQHLLAGQVLRSRPSSQYLPAWINPNYEFSVPVSPVGNGLLIKGQVYRTSNGVIGNGLFWLVSFMSLLTAWMLIGTWRHTRRRLQAQRDLLSETNFRRAMENSMLTGMRAMDMKGCITYVNSAFCQMTGWSENELVGQYPPFPHWPESDHELLAAKLA